jgi:hypothetical protein
MQLLGLTRLRLATSKISCRNIESPAIHSGALTVAATWGLGALTADRHPHEFPLQYLVSKNKRSAKQSRPPSTLDALRDHLWGFVLRILLAGNFIGRSATLPFLLLGDYDPQNDHCQNDSRCHKSADQMNGIAPRIQSLRLLARAIFTQRGQAFSF